VWNKLGEVASELDARLLVATPGNHDLDSRYLYTEYDARGQAMLLMPTLPVRSRATYLEFWAEHFAFVELADSRILLLNSSAYHGGGKNPEEERENGRVSAPTLRRIESELARLPIKPVNVLICHHHPDDPEEILENDRSVMEGGKKLLHLLNDSNVGPWLVIHGHKHRPRLFYSGGSGDTPLVLGSASFSAQINRDATNKCPNQFHIVEFNAQGATQIGVGLAGIIRSWNWTIGEGWNPAQGPYGLPHRSGFGFRGNIALVANRVRSLIPDGQFRRWCDLVNEIPELEFLLPKDYQKLRANFRTLGIELLEKEGVPAQVARK
jgi:hypothetical protein